MNLTNRPLLFSSDNTMDRIENSDMSRYLEGIPNYLQVIEQYLPQDLQNTVQNYDNSFYKQKEKDDEDYVSFSLPISELKENNINGLTSNILGLIELIRSIPEVSNKVKISSGFRKGAKTKQGRDSYHASGNAIDIVPNGCTFKELSDALMNNSQIVNYLMTHNLGIIDETTPDIMTKTGATGKHYHIGPDKIGKSGIYSLLTKYGYA